MKTKQIIERILMQDVRDGLLILENKEVENIVEVYSFEQIREILIFALSDSTSEYWTILALNLLNKKSEYISDEIILILNKIASMPKRYTQKTRHEALKIFKKQLGNINY
ncbi:hypothetical protein [Acinetobacter lactucae]|uniref:hypothetical protein n=1 Tax=Acinetobacter lactucae TaxID=1785128 RepID=UPI001E3DEC9F|nr:hypothetical protein [Acinetobacter lactucae]